MHNDGVIPVDDIGARKSLFHFNSFFYMKLHSGGREHSGLVVECLSCD